MERAGARRSVRLFQCRKRTEANDENEGGSLEGYERFRRRAGQSRDGEGRLQVTLEAALGESSTRRALITTSLPMTAFLTLSPSTAPTRMGNLGKNNEKVRMAQGLL